MGGSCPCSDHDNAKGRKRNDSSVAVSVEDKNRLIEEAAAAGMDVKKYLAKILREHWGES